MSTKESAVIAELQQMQQQGFITAHELDWCVGAVRNRSGLTAVTRSKLRDSVHTILKQARTRFEAKSK
jgi:hypothetical protein